MKFVLYRSTDDYILVVDNSLAYRVPSGHLNKTMNHYVYLWGQGKCTLLSVAPHVFYQDSKYRRWCYTELGGARLRKLASKLYG